MIYDVIILGGGIAGLTAGIYAGRAGLKAVLIEKMFLGGQAVNIHQIENFPGFPEGISGPDLSARLYEQAVKFGLETVYAAAEEVKLNGDIKCVVTDNGEYLSKALIIASGSSRKKLSVPGEETFRGRGVSYCATCDGAFFKNKTVAVVGGGDAAVEDAIFLSTYAKKVFLIHRRDELRANKRSQANLFQRENVEILWHSVVKEIRGDIAVERLLLQNTLTGTEKELPADGIFIAIGINPTNELLRGKVELSDTGFIKTTERMETSVNGVYAAGDIRFTPLWQLVTSASDGAVASYYAAKYALDR